MADDMKPVYFWTRPLGGTPICSRGFLSAEAADEWATPGAWRRLLCAVGATVICVSDHREQIGPSEALDLAERAPICDEQRRLIALHAAGVARRRLDVATSEQKAAQAASERVIRRAAQVLRMTRGVER